MHGAAEGDEEPESAKRKQFRVCLVLDSSVSSQSARAWSWPELSLLLTHEGHLGMKVRSSTDATCRVSPWACKGAVNALAALHLRTSELPPSVRDPFSDSLRSDLPSSSPSTRVAHACRAGCRSELKLRRIAEIHWLYLIHRPLRTGTGSIHHAPAESNIQDFSQNLGLVTKADVVKPLTSSRPGGFGAWGPACLSKVHCCLRGFAVISVLRQAIEPGYL